MFKPMQKKVLLRRVREEKRRGKLFLPSKTRLSWFEYVVVRAGPRCVELAPGDRVLAPERVGVPITEVELLGEEGLGRMEGVRLAEETDIWVKVLLK